MKTKVLILVAACCALSSMAQNSGANRVMSAVMAAYEEALVQNPNDYRLLFDRANQYFLNKEYDKSLADVSKALQQTSRKERGLLFDEYMLRAGIYDIKNDYGAMLADANSALSLDHKSVAALHLRAKSYLKTGEYDKAMNDYNAVIRLAPIDYEAYAGVARAAALQQNEGMAIEYARKAVDMYPAQSAVYINMADIQSILGDYDAAAYNLIYALSLDYEDENVLNGLFALARSHYSAVDKAFAEALTKVPSSGMLQYLRAMIAMDHCDYKLAVKEISDMLSRKLYDNAGIYRDLATAYFGLCRYEDALSAINNSIAVNPNDASSYVLRAKILHSLTQIPAALKSVDEALRIDSGNTDALLEKSALCIANKNVADALVLLGEAVALNPDNAEAYMIRAKIKAQMFDDKQGALNDYRIVFGIQDDTFDGYGAMSAVFLGETGDATRQVEDMLKGNPGNVNALFTASAVWIAVGDKQKSLDCVEKLLVDGYGDLHRLTSENPTGIDLSKLHGDARFVHLLEQYKSNFK